MLPINVAKPEDWTDKDKWVCIARWLEAAAYNVFNSRDPDYQGIKDGEKGDPCFECPAGKRCPAWCDETHWKKYTEFYAYENMKIVEQFSGFPMNIVNSILKQYYDRSIKDTSQALMGIDSPEDKNRH